MARWPYFWPADLTRTANPMMSIYFFFSFLRFVPLFSLSLHGTHMHLVYGRTCMAFSLSTQNIYHICIGLCSICHLNTIVLASSSKPPKPSKESLHTMGWLYVSGFSAAAVCPTNNTIRAKRFKFPIVPTCTARILLPSDATDFQHKAHRRGACALATPGRTSTNDDVKQANYRGVKDIILPNFCNVKQLNFIILPR